MDEMANVIHDSNDSPHTKSHLLEQPVLKISYLKSVLKLMLKTGPETRSGIIVNPIL